MLGILPPNKSRCLSAKASTSGVAGETKDCERQKSPLVLSSEDDENVGMPLAPVAAKGARERRPESVARRRLKPIRLRLGNRCAST
jgi:hypothetical protein